MGRGPGGSGRRVGGDACDESPWFKILKELIKTRKKELCVKTAFNADCQRLQGLERWPSAESTGCSVMGLGVPSTHPSWAVH